MPMIVCVKCRKFFHPKKNGVCVEEGMPTGDSGKWLPYKLWQADLVSCHSCGTEIIAGFGRWPISEHYREDYKFLKKQFNPIVFVEDCY